MTGTAPDLHRPAPATRWLRLAWPLAFTVLSACAAQPELQENQALIDTIHAAVPDSWRAGAAGTPVIEPLALNDDLRGFISARVPGKATPRRRMLALANAIFDPEGVGLLYDEDATYTAIETFEKGFGNCMAFSNLMVAGAREAGLGARFELVSNLESWQQQGDMLVRTMHMRAVVEIRDKKMIFDFYPEPVQAGSWHRPVSDDQARAHHLNNLAAVSMQRRDYARAYGQLARALEISPALSFLWSNLGALLSRNEMTGLAEHAYKEAVRLDPDQLTAVSNLQRLYTRTGRLQEAAALEETVRQYRERNPYYHFEHAEQAYAEGRFEDARQHYRRAIKLKKNEREFYVGLARTYYKLGKTLAARRTISKSHEIFSPEADTVMVRPSRKD